MKIVNAAPRASILVESMRDIGYSLETALADVIDNSITAGAKTIRMVADTNIAEPYFAVIDDGIGMDAGELLNAMRFGSRSPLDKRDSGDLGRFGLGMKTASFSQCRRLTVLSRKNGETVCACWDLDQVEKSDDWLVEVLSDTTEIPCVDLLGQTGTLILWEKLDRLIDKHATDDGNRNLVRRIDDAIDHLELVFHRFLSGERGIKRVTMHLNGRKLEPFDPFHTVHPATISGPVEVIRLNGQEITLQTFTLPHHKKVSLQDWEKYAGRAGYMKNQGFYVYRGKRLIIHGTWFGLARQMELTKLARVRIDMPNDLDADWKIDVKKASAHPPHQVRDHLRRIIETIGATSRRVYTARGRKLISDSRLPVWLRIQDKNEISYRVNPDHPVFVEFMSHLTDEMKQDFLKIIEMTGAAIPVDALFADISSQPERVGGSAMSLEAQTHVVTETFRHLSQTGLANEDIIEMLRVTEPFRASWVQTQQIIQTILQEGSADA